MAEYVVLQHHHYGWTKRAHHADTAEEAMRLDILSDHKFLSEMPHSLEFADGRYAVRHIGPARILPLGQMALHDGDYWFGDRIHVGHADDCDGCGGTGANHYNPFRQCWKCGDANTDGKSSGKTLDRGGQPVNSGGSSHG